MKNNINATKESVKIDSNYYQSTTPSNLLLQNAYNKAATLSNNFFANNKPSTPINCNRKKERQSISKTNQVFVKKWVDYSTKYGLGYLLSDGTTGIYFNDSTKMCLDNQAQ